MTGRAAGGEPDRQAVMRAVVETVAEILPALPVSEITGNRHVKELGADSVDRVEIILGVLDRLGLAAPLSAFAELPDLDALAGLLTRLLRADAATATAPGDPGERGTP